MIFFKIEFAILERVLDSCPKRETTVLMKIVELMKYFI